MVETICSIVTTSVTVLGLVYTIYKDHKDEKSYGKSYLVTTDMSIYLNCQLDRTVEDQSPSVTQNYNIKPIFA